jgi:hypothetical protein
LPAERPDVGALVIVGADPARSELADGQRSSVC